MPLLKSLLNGEKLLEAVFVASNVKMLTFSRQNAWIFVD
jgi:hypothetical protein